MVTTAAETFSVPVCVSSLNADFITTCVKQYQGNRTAYYLTHRADDRVPVVAEEHVVAGDVDGEVARRLAHSGAAAQVRQLAAYGAHCKRRDRVVLGDVLGARVHNVLRGVVAEERRVLRI